MPSRMPNHANARRTVQIYKATGALLQHVDNSNGVLYLPKARARSMAAQVTVRPRKTCWDYSMQNMSLIVAVKSNALNDCKAALDDNAILEWLTPGYYRILGENDDDEDSPIMNKEDLEEASLDFPGYESNYQA